MKKVIVILASFIVVFSMVKSDADLSKKSWSTSEEVDYYKCKLPQKAEQIIVLMDLDKNPREYNGFDLVQEIADELNESSSITISVVQAMIAIDKYNEKFKEKKVEYNEEELIKSLVSKQKESDKKIYLSLF